MNPFLYPKSKHRRRLEPPAYIAYSSFKEFLRIEFDAQCVYCRLPDGPKGRDDFGVDHYRPKRDFPELATTYANLFYACNCCNRRKGRFWPTQEQLRKAEFIPNPCDHIMFDHLRYQGARVEPHSAAGRQADRVLMFNDEESIRYREFVFDAIEFAEDKKRQIEETLRIIEECIAQSSSPQLEEDKRAAERDHARVIEHLKRLGA